MTLSALRHNMNEARIAYKNARMELAALNGDAPFFSAPYVKKQRSSLFVSLNRARAALRRAMDAVERALGIPPRQPKPRPTKARKALAAIVANPAKAVQIARKAGAA